MLWLAHGGHSTTTIGALGFAYRALGTVSPTVIGGLADAHSRHREYLIVATVVNALAIVSLTLWPQSVPWQAACLVAAALSDSSALLDAIIVRSMSWSGAADAAPRSRAFGALGWILAAPAFGAVNGAFGLAWLIRLYAPLLLFALPACLSLPIREAYAKASDTTTKVQSAGPNGSSPEGGSIASAEPSHGKAWSLAERIGLVLRKPRILLQLLLTFLIGMHFGVGFSFGFLFLEQELSATPIQLALSTFSQALIEMPLFQVAAPLCRRVGVLNALLSCQLAAALRFTGYVTMSSVWAVLPFDVGHGWSFALVYTATALLGEGFTEDGLQATVVGLGNSAMALGQCSATLTWAALISYMGMRPAFITAAATFLTAFAAVPLARAVISFLRAMRKLCMGHGQRQSSSLLAPTAPRSELELHEELEMHPHPGQPDPA